jgi:hypothetical protein
MRMIRLSLLTLAQTVRDMYTANLNIMDKMDYVNHNYLLVIGNCRNPRSNRAREQERS